MVTRTLERKNNNNIKSDLILKSLLTWMTEKELKRYIKNKEEQFCWKKNKKIGGVKVRNGNGQQSENERQ